MKTKKYTVEQLEKAGGKLWRKGNISRVYFNNLKNRIGLTVNYYKTGNVSSASLDGLDYISNGKASGLLSMCLNGKVWYDLSDNNFHTKNIDADYRYRGSKINFVDRILTSIENDIN